MSVSIRKGGGNTTTSEGNSTTATLGPGETFTGTWERAPSDGVTVSVLSDTAGTLYFDFSNDNGATLHSTFPPAGFGIGAGVHGFHVAKVNGRSFRVRFVNSASTQTSFNLATFYGPHTQPNAPINSSINKYADATIVRVVDSAVDLSLGRFGGMIEDGKFGSVVLADALDEPEDIWDFASDDINAGSTLKTFPTSATSIFLSSSTAADTDVRVTLNYIDSIGSAASVEVTANGQTPVDIGDDGFDVNRAFISGSVAPLGDIYINTQNDHSAGIPVSAATVLAFIRSTHGQTQQALYTVPLGKVMRIKYIILDMARASGGVGSVEVHLRVREFGKTWIVKRRFFITNSVGIFKPSAGLVIPARANIAVRAVDISDGDTNITAEWHFDLVDTD